MWKLRSKPQFCVRIDPYQQCTQEQNWNEGLSVATRHRNIVQMEYFIWRGATDWDLALQSAVHAGDLKLIEFFLDKGAAPKHGLRKAVSLGNRSLVNYFIQKIEDFQNLHNIHPKNRPLTWEKPLETAAFMGQRDLVDLFISKGAHGFNQALASASSGGHQELVEFFLRKGASDIKSGMAEAVRRGHKHLVDFFISKGVSDWEFGMQNATRGGQKELVEFFVQKGANGWNEAINVAMMCGSTDMVAYFLEKGANPEHALKNIDHYSSTEQQLEIVKLLVLYGAKALDKALVSAVIKKHGELVEFLIEQGANFHKGLHQAILQKDASIFQIFLKREPDINQIMIKEIEHYPLSIKQNHVEFLIQMGANNVQEALETAVSAGNYAVLDFLVNKGANMSTAIAKQNSKVLYFKKS